MREISYQAFVIPTNVGIQYFRLLRCFWIPASAGMTNRKKKGEKGDSLLSENYYISFASFSVGSILSKDYTLIPEKDAFPLFF